jgi:FixJ family two-component response regulator
MADRLQLPMFGAPDTIFIIDDDLSTRNALGRLLEVNGFRTVLFRSAEEILNTHTPIRPVCMLVDIQLPGLDGLGLQDVLRARNADAPLIFISGHGDIPIAVRAFRSGAAGFLPKPFTEAELLSEIKRAVQGYRATISVKSEIEDLKKRFEKLTNRERQIMLSVVNGKLNKQTAFDLGIVENTVKVHRGRIMRKMQADSIQQLVLMAQRLNLTKETVPSSPASHQLKWPLSA